MEIWAACLGWTMRPPRKYQAARGDQMPQRADRAERAESQRGLDSSASGDRLVQWP